MRFLVTAGPTHEPIDEVRYIGNRSSGRMGIAIAEAAAAAGVEVTLLLGPVAVPTPARRPISGVETLSFRTTDDLRDLLTRLGPTADVIVMAAAVADFRPSGAPRPGKIEREKSLRLELEPTPDLLAELSQRRRHGQFLVGFALEEPEQLEKRARAKLVRKGIDAIVANPLATMDAPDVDGRLFLADGRVLRPAGGGPVDKRTFAQWLVSTLLGLQIPPTQCR